MRKTKIICTIGPASSNEHTLKQMIQAGMNVARLNFSHGSYPEHKGKIDLIKKVRQELNVPIPIMLDTKGPEYRIKTFKNEKVLVRNLPLQPAMWKVTKPSSVSHTEGW